MGRGALATGGAAGADKHLPWVAIELQLVMQ